LQAAHAHISMLAYVSSEVFARLVYRLVHRDLQLPASSLLKLLALMRSVSVKG
jgi:hypothetical protein